jgi:hypothetical protein
MLRVCKLLLLMFFISPVFAAGEENNNGALKAKEIYFDSKNDLIRAKGDVSFKWTVSPLMHKKLFTI